MQPEIAHFLRKVLCALARFRKLYDGYAIIDGPQANVMGSEQPIMESTKAQSGTGPNKAKATDAGATAALDKQDVVPSMAPVNRESTAVQGEAGIEQYSEIVDRYFKAISKPETKPDRK